MKQKMTGGRAIAAALRHEGIEHVFGIVGTHNCPLYDGVYHEPSIRAVTVRHEQGATLMAAGYARASGKVAACFVVPGPGLTNALTGMGMAYSESAPMLVFGGQNALSQLEREGDHFHELRNSLAVGASVSGYATRLAQAADVPAVVREALRSIHSGRPRPAYIEVPLDVQLGEAEVAMLPSEDFRRPAGDAAAIARAAQALRSAKRPFILAGGGVATAQGSDALAKVAEALGAPVVTSIFARGVISDRHPLALGDGWGRLDLYDELQREADLVLVVGSRIDVVSDWSLGAKLPPRIVQVDIDPGVIGRRRPVEVGVVGDAGAVLAALARELGGGAPKSWCDVTAFRARKRARLLERAAPAAQVIEDLRASVPDDTIFVDDLTMVGYWLPVVMDAYAPRTVLHPGTYGTLGYALPAAIGAKLACPTQPVVAVSGDGGFLFTPQELSTAVTEKLDLVVLVFNDNAYGAIKTYQDRVFAGRRIGTHLANPDIVQLGRAFGCQAERVEAAQVGAAVKRAQQAGGTWVIEVPFAPDGPANLPPWMP